MKECPRCKRTHIGSLMLAPVGFRVIFLSAWEQSCSESDLEYQFRNQIPLRSMPSSVLRFPDWRQFAH